MQTFLPYRSFESSARVLDMRRLGKQRVETLQIMKALATGEGWVNHPVTKMWRGSEGALLSYQWYICKEWQRRGYKDTCWVKTRDLYYSIQGDRGFRPGNVLLPPFIGLRRFHSAHRANLLRKDPLHYGRFSWPEEPAEGYWYPVIDDRGRLVG